jgi:hypothetical protein
LKRSGREGSRAGDGILYEENRRKPLASISLLLQENDPLSPMEGQVRNELRKEISFSSISVQISEAIIPIRRGH